MPITDPTDIPNLLLWLQQGVGMYDATSGGSPVTTSGGAIARWEDQSGNGNHATQATSANRPLYDATRGCVSFCEGSDHILALPAGVTFDRQGVTVFAVLRMVTNRQPASGAIHHVIYQSGSENLLVSVYGLGGDLTVFDGAGQYGGGPTTPRCDFHTLGFRSNASNFHRHVAAVSDPHTPLTSATAAGGRIGHASADVKAVVIVGRGVSDAEYEDLRQWALTLPGVKDDADVVCTFSGDSITSGIGATLNRNYPVQVARLAVELKPYTFARSGIPLQYINDDEAACVDPVYEAGKTNVSFLMGGTNDLQLLLSTAATVKGLTEDWGDARRAAAAGLSGATLKLVIFGILPGIPQESERQALRSLMLADFDVPTAKANVWAAGDGVTYADYYVDLGADTTIGEYGDHENPTYYSDGVHPTTAGYAVIAAYADDALDLILSAEPPVVQHVAIALAGGGGLVLSVEA